MPLKRMIKIIAMIFAIAFFTQPASALTPVDWSFEDHQHPSVRDLSLEKKRLLGQAYEEDKKSPGCSTLIATEFKFYTDKYPKYLEVGDEEILRQKWLDYVTQSGHVKWATCFYAKPHDAFYELATTYKENDREFYFCGLPSHSPANDYERSIVEHSSRMIFYAQKGVFHAVFYLMLANHLKTVFHLNPDIEYYFRKITKEAPTKSKDFSNVSHLTPKLSPERIAFLDEAVKRLDYQAVLETTQPCKAR